MASNLSLKTTDTSANITVRFGDDLMQAGFTALPNLVLDHYAALGVTPAEMMFIIHIWQYWWNARDPHPSLRTIATKMQTSWRNAQRYLASLKTKKLLTVTARHTDDGRQVSNEYDFAPFIQALRARAGSTTPPAMTNLSSPPTTLSSSSPTTDLSPLKEDKEQKDKFIFEGCARRENAHTQGVVPTDRAEYSPPSKAVRTGASVTPQGGTPPTSAFPTTQASVASPQALSRGLERMREILGRQVPRSPKTASDALQGPKERGLPRKGSSDQPGGSRSIFGHSDAAGSPSEGGARNGQNRTLSTHVTRYERHAHKLGVPDPLWVTLQEFSAELGDQAPTSTLTWVTHQWRESNLALDTFMGTLYAARSITRSAPRITARTRTGGTNRTPYFKQVVGDELAKRRPQNTQASLSPP